MNRHLGTQAGSPPWQTREKPFLPDWWSGMPFSCSLSVNLFLSTQKLQSLAEYPYFPMSWASWKDWRGFCKHDQLRRAMPSGNGTKLIASPVEESLRWRSSWADLGLLHALWGSAEITSAYMSGGLVSGRNFSRCAINNLWIGQYIKTTLCTAPSKRHKQN